MIKKTAIFVLAGFLLINFCGCAFVGNCIRQTYKVDQTFDASYSRAIDAVKDTLINLNLKIVKAVIEPEQANVKARYDGEKFVYVTIFKIDEKQTRIEVRVGTSETGKKSAEDILRSVAEYLSITNNQ